MSSVIIRRSIIGTTRFRKLKICEDYFFKCQMLKKAKNAYCLPKITTKYRIRSNSLQSKKFRNLFFPTIYILIILLTSVIALKFLK